MSVYYRVMTWEPVSEKLADGYRWQVRVVRVRKWRLRAVLRRLLEHYGKAEIKIERWSS